jgi:hypothetical protein
MTKFSFTMVLEVAVGVALGMIVYNLVAPMISKYTASFYEGDNV